MSYQRNIWLLQTLFICGRSIAIGMPAYIPLMEDNGLSDSVVFSLEAIFIGILMILQTPTGYLADHWGRKRCIILGNIIWIIGMLMFMIAESYWCFLAIQIIMAIGLSCISGADIALLKNSLTKIGQEQEYQARLARMLGWAQVAQTIFFVIGGLILPYGLRLPFAISTLGYIVYSGLSLLLTDDMSWKPEKRASVKELWDLGYYYLLEHSYVSWIIWTQALTLGATYIGFWYFIPLLREAEIPRAQYGYLLAGLSCITAAFNFLAPRLESKNLRGSTLVVLLAFCLSLLLPSSGIFGLIIAGSILQKIILGIGLVAFTHKISQEVPNDRQATLLSISGTVLNASQLGLLLLNASLLYWLQSATWALLVCGLTLSILGVMIVKLKSP